MNSNSNMACMHVHMNKRGNLSPIARDSDYQSDALTSEPPELL